MRSGRATDAGGALIRLLLLVAAVGVLFFGGGIVWLSERGTEVVVPVIQDGLRDMADKAEQRAEEQAKERKAEERKRHERAG
jgi:hypothetical protein